MLIITLLPQHPIGVGTDNRLRRFCGRATVITLPEGSNVLRSITTIAGCPGFYVGTLCHFRTCVPICTAAGYVFQIIPRSSKGGYPGQPSTAVKTL